MKREMLVPLLNTNDERVDVVEWHVAEGDYVDVGTEIVDLETTKVVVTVESEASGYLLAHCRAGETVLVGAPLATFFDDLAELESSRDAPAEVPPVPAMPLPLQEGQDAVEGIPVAAVAATAPPVFPFTRFSQQAEAYLARHQIDPRSFEGSGLVTRAAIEEALRRARPSPSSSGSSPTNGRASEHSGPAPDASASRVERISASKAYEIDRLTAGQAGGITSSLSVQFNSAGIRQALAEAEALNGQLLPLILYELARVLEVYPAFTAYYEDGHLHYYDRIDVGVAIDMGKGLKVPVLRDAHLRTPAALLEAVTACATAYLENRLTEEDLTGGTITVSDLSSEGILHFKPLLNDWQSVILGIGGDRSLAGAPMTLTVVFDHRVLTGRVVAAFLRTLKENLLSYALIAAQPAAETPDVRSIRCSLCRVDLESLYQLYPRDALMHLHMNAEGQTAYICHVCMGGY